MNTIRKELEFPAPPEGWEIDRYGRVQSTGEMYHSMGQWNPVIPSDVGVLTECYLIARKKQSPAEWANAQPDLAALARVLEGSGEEYLLWLYAITGQHILEKIGTGVGTYIHLRPCPHQDKAVRLADGKWEDFTP